MGFYRPTLTFSHKLRKCVSPPDAGGMNHGTDARLRDGSGANSRKTGGVRFSPGSCPNSRSIPLGVIGYFPMVFTHRLPQLDSPAQRDCARVFQGPLNRFHWRYATHRSSPKEAAYASCGDMTTWRVSGGTSPRASLSM